MTTAAAAPSLIPDAFPAVTVPPSFLKAGGSFAIFSSEVSIGRSSTMNVTSPFFDGMTTGTISSATAPLAIAARARWWLISASSSCSRRVIPYRAAMFSAVKPMW